MMRRAAEHAKTLLPVVFALAVAAILVGAFRFFATMSVHPDPGAVPSTSSTHAGRYSAAVEESRRLARETLLAENLPGLSVAVGVGSDIVWADGFGWADLERRLPVRPDTRFRIGTASTALTSAAAGLLLERGELKLDEPIQSYVPQFPTKPWPVTLKQVMAHVAGVRSDSGDEGPLFSQRCAQPVEALPHFADRDLLFEPATAFRSSRYGWILVSAAIEADSDEPFLSFMQRAVFQPLGMHATGAESTSEENPEHAGEPSEDAPIVNLVRDLVLQPLGMVDPEIRATIPDLSTFYFPRYGADPRYGQHEMRPLNLSCYAGSMAFLSTPSDLVRFGLAMNNGGLLHPATVRLLQTSQQLTSGAETGYGLGWDLETVTLAGQPTASVGHNGDSLGGMVASLVTFPERGIVVAVTSNISYANTFSLASKVAEAFAAEEAR
jgi:serine beta-lactamase-like protein LACTB